MAYVRFYLPTLPHHKLTVEDWKLLKETICEH